MRRWSQFSQRDTKIRDVIEEAEMRKYRKAASTPRFHGSASSDFVLVALLLVGSLAPKSQACSPSLESWDIKVSDPELPARLAITVVVRWRLSTIQSGRFLDAFRTQRWNHPLKGRLCNGQSAKDV